MSFESRRRQFGEGDVRGRHIALAVSALILSACGSLAYHRVEDGETLYSIGWQYGYDYRTVAAWNDIDAPYVIKPGQWLRVAPPPGGGAGVHQAPQPHHIIEASVSPPHDHTPPPPQAHRPIKWSWPARGRLVVKFSPDHPMRKGVDIGGHLGEPVRAAAAGRVVYSGSGLIGYGNLVIIKHNEHYLSAYGYNRTLLVKEGDEVARGQEIAEMGTAASGDKDIKLHFEIRRDGDPVNPLKYLPGR
jgi:lipoprotein NlpD